MATLEQTSSGLDVNGGTSGTLSLTSVTSGNLMIVVVADADANTVTFQVTDDLGNDWRRAVGQSGSSDGRSEIWYCLNALPGSPTITVTADFSTIFIARAQEWSGGTWTLDVSSSINETLATSSHVCSANSAEIDTSAAAVVICAAGRDGTSVLGTRTAGSGYTAFNGPTGTTNYDRAHWQYQDFGAATNNEQGAYTADVSRTTVGCIAAFVYSGGGGGGCWWPCCTGSGGPGICTIRKLDSSGALQWTFLGHLSRSGSGNGSGVISIDSVNSAIVVPSGHGSGTDTACIESIPFAGGAPNWVSFSSYTTSQNKDACVESSDDRVFWSGSTGVGFDLDGNYLFDTGTGETTVAVPGVLWSYNPGGGFVRQINTSDGTVLILSTAGAAGDSYIADVDSSGNLWGVSITFAEFQVVDVTDGSQLATHSITTDIADQPFIALDSSDNIYLANYDSANPTDALIEKWNSGISKQWSTSFTANSGSGRYPIAVDSSGNVYVGNGTEVRKYNSSGVFQWAYDHGAELWDVAVDPSDNVYIAGDQAVV